MLQLASACCCRRAAAQPVKLRIESDRGALARAVASAARLGRERGRWCSSPRGRATASIGHGEAAPLEGYDGVSLDDVLSGARGLPRRRVARPTASRPRGRAGAMRRGGRCPRRWRRSTWRCGTWPGRRAGAARVAAARRAHRPAGRGQRDDRRGRSRRAPRPRRPTPAQAGFRTHQGQGRASATTPAAGRGPRPSPARDMLIRVDANGAWSSPRPPRALRALARPIELCEEPVHGVEQIASVARADPSAARARRERRRSPARSTRSGVRRRLPEDRPLRRDHRRARRRRAGARSRLRGVPRLDARRAAGDRSGAARGGGGRARPAIAGWRRWACSSRRSRAAAGGRGGHDAHRPPGRGLATVYSPGTADVVAIATTRLGRLEVDGVAGAGDDHRRSRPGSPRAICAGERRELRRRARRRAA